MPLPRFETWAGNTVRVTATASNTVGASPPIAADVAFKVTKPDGTVLTPPAQAGTQPGEFYADVPTDLPGNWYVRVSTAGVVASVQVDRFTVRKSDPLP